MRAKPEHRRGSLSVTHPKPDIAIATILSLELFGQFGGFSNPERPAEKIWLGNTWKGVSAPASPARTLPRNLGTGALETVMRNAPGELVVAVDQHRATPLVVAEEGEHHLAHLSVRGRHAREVRVLCVLMLEAGGQSPCRQHGQVPVRRKPGHRRRRVLAHWPQDEIGLGAPRRRHAVHQAEECAVAAVRVFIGHLEASAGWQKPTPGPVALHASQRIFDGRPHPGQGEQPFSLKPQSPTSARAGAPPRHTATVVPVSPWPRTRQLSLSIAPGFENGNAFESKEMRAGPREFALEPLYGQESSVPVHRHLHRREQKSETCCSQRRENSSSEGVRKLEEHLQGVLWALFAKPARETLCSGFCKAEKGLASESQSCHGSRPQQRWRRGWKRPWRSPWPESLGRVCRAAGKV
ncbi:uncharacterized protein LOC116659893 [Camelus ferus]|uniref:Uncharacterized protein LOC116659893 n=1 Tax=Camelus ferus TaxID=419612 RepID=A0A8B8S348_CAMFR|nr:uncharacterized protein LOC116659893 [Camelus ferus]